MLLNTLALSLATLAHIVYAGPPLHRVEEPDYIIVGGGIAGFVLANRLTENPNIQVHLLEAGPDPAGDPDVSTPAFAGLLDTTKYTYNLTTTPQASLNGTTVHTVQGHGLGGGSSVNYMQYCRGAASVYDEWASITDDDGWAWDNLLPYFERSTSLVPPTESFHPVANTSMYGQGPLSLTFGKDVDVLAPEFIKVMEQSGLPQHDLNDGNGIYTSYVTQYVLSSNATRESSLTTYGYPALLRPNLQLTKNAWVTKINFLGTRAISVTYTDTIDNSTHTLFPKVDGEIIISGGAINSPKLLMLSGIGPREHLESLNIPVIADLPVGSTMQNHYGTAMTLNVSSEQWSATQLTNQTYLDIALANYTQNASGQLAQAVTSVTAAGRAPNNLSEWHASLPADRAHWLTNTANALLLPPTTPYPPTTNAISVITFLIAPQSRGTVRLASTDPFTNPLLDPNVFGTPDDRAVFFWAYQHVRSLFKSLTVSDVVLGELFPGEEVEGEEEVWKAIAESVFDFRHPVGTVPLGDVLESDFRIKGLRGIRVVDSSAMPQIPTCQISAAVYALAERAADVIKEEFACRRGA